VTNLSLGEVILGRDKDDKKNKKKRRVRAWPRRPAPDPGRRRFQKLVTYADGQPFDQVT
jgi:hypothetical protein